jgi:DNA polymerase III sliding clamp (beta) subunit (PCNA family)
MLTASDIDSTVAVVWGNCSFLSEDPNEARVVGVSPGHLAILKKLARVDDGQVTVELWPKKIVIGGVDFENSDVQPLDWAHREVEFAKFPESVHVLDCGEISKVNEHIAGILSFDPARNLNVVHFKRDESILFAEGTDGHRAHRIFLRGEGPDWEFYIPKVFFEGVFSVLPKKKLSELQLFCKYDAGQNKPYQQSILRTSIALDSKVTIYFYYNFATCQTFPKLEDVMPSGDFSFKLDPAALRKTVNELVMRKMIKKTSSEDVRHMSLMQVGDWGETEVGIAVDMDSKKPLVGKTEKSVECPFKMKFNPFFLIDIAKMFEKADGEVEAFTNQPIENDWHDPLVIRSDRVGMAMVMPMRKL